MTLSHYEKIIDGILDPDIGPQVIIDESDMLYASQSATGWHPYAPECCQTTMYTEVPFRGAYVYQERWRQSPYPAPWLKPLPYWRAGVNFLAPSGTADYRYYYNGATSQRMGYFRVRGLETAAQVQYFTPDLDVNYVTDRSVNDALRKLSNNNLQIVNDLLEARETAGLFKSTVNSVARSVMAFRRRNPKDWLRVRHQQMQKRENTRNLYGYPDSWLSLQYGWKPLLSELQAGLDLLSEVPLQKLQFAVSVKGKAKDTRKGWRSWTICSENQPVFAGDGCFTNGCFVVGGEEKYEIKALTRLDYIMPYPTQRIYEQLGVVNLPGIVWEAVPYSFVVDQFLPIGNYINGWTADFGFSYRSGSKSTTVKYESVIGGPVESAPSSNLLEAHVSDGYVKSFSHNRIVLDDTPVPVYPRVRNGLMNVFNVANDMALLVNAFK